ncbi:MAG: PEP-CTERM sorting domain-containing protein [Bryobacteraceae bacterium]
MKRLLVLLVAVLCASVMPVMADGIIQLGGTDVPGDYYGLFEQSSLTNPVDTIDVFVTTPGVSLSTPGLVQDPLEPSAGWTETDITSQYSSATFTSTLNVYFEVSFSECSLTNPSCTSPAPTIDLYAFSDGTLVDSGTFVFDGAGSTFEGTPGQAGFAADLANNTVPEPATLAIVGAGLLGLVATRYRRRA